MIQTIIIRKLGYVVSQLKLEVVNIEQYYIWISMINDLKGREYKELLDKFNSLTFLYKISKKSFLFKKYLEHFNLKISFQVYSKLINPKIKENSYKLYKTLKSNNIHIKVIDKLPFLSIPIVLFIKGKIKILEEEKIIYFLKDCNINKNVEKLYESFNEFLLKNGYYEVTFQNKLYNYYKNKIAIINFKLDKLFFNMLKNIECDNSVIIFSTKNICFENLKEYNRFLLSIITKKVLVLSAQYNTNNINLIDNLLEQGKDIYAVPGDINESSNYLSNYLIKNGAEAIICKNDLNYI